MRPGVLKGQREEKMGDKVTAMNKNAQAQTSGSVVLPMEEWISEVKKHSPTKKRTNES